MMHCINNNFYRVSNFSCNSSRNANINPLVVRGNGKIDDVIREFSFVLPFVDKRFVPLAHLVGHSPGGVVEVFALWDKIGYF